MLSRIHSFFGLRISFKFLVWIAAVTAVIFVLAFLWSSHQQKQHIMEQVKKQAVILYKQIVLTRRWVADHHSVLVPKSKEAQPSPFLDEPEVRSMDGTVYVKISPSLITKMLSERASQSGMYAFKLTSDDRLNPENVPDSFEKEAIAHFRATGVTDSAEGIFRIEEREGKTLLRYAAPVMVNKSCLKCHMAQGRKPGDVGGCLSVLVPMDEARKAISRNRAILLGGGIGLCGSLVLVLFVAARAMVFKRISEIRAVMESLPVVSRAEKSDAKGDELTEISDYLSLLDEKLRQQHQELENKIADATKDLSETNKRLESANEELVRLNRAKSDFFADISHELRTPLTSIKGAADLLERKFSCDDPTYLQIIKRNTDHLIRTVVDFLDYSKIESGQLELHMAYGKLGPVVEQAVLSQNAQTKDKLVHISFIGNDDIIAKFDKQRIYQVLMNLLSNAVRHSPPDGTVEVSVSGSNGEVQVCVADNGSGIDPRYHTAIFEKFYQVIDEQAGAMHKGSAGIGLAICRGLIEAHNGRIWVESKPGHGSRFYFALPKQG